jgi:hypothetical protein
MRKRGQERLKLEKDTKFGLKCKHKLFIIKLFKIIYNTIFGATTFTKMKLNRIAHESLSAI